MYVVWYSHWNLSTVPAVSQNTMGIPKRYHETEDEGQYKHSRADICLRQQSTNILLLYLEKRLPPNSIYYIIMASK